LQMILIQMAHGHRAILYPHFFGPVSKLSQDLLEILKRTKTFLFLEDPSILECQNKIVKIVVNVKSLCKLIHTLAFEVNSKILDMKPILKWSA
jgi:hypothetical protein